MNQAPTTPDAMSAMSDDALAVSLDYLLVSLNYALASYTDGFYPNPKILLTEAARRLRARAEQDKANEAHNRQLNEAIASLTDRINAALAATTPPDATP